MKFGLCCSPATLGLDESTPVATFHDNIARLKNAGADYLEFGVGSTLPEGDSAQWEALRAAMQNAPLGVDAFNAFIPARHRITGPAVNLESVLEYSRVALARCRALGGGVVVLGSGGARKVPEGFDFKQAEKQFVEFCRKLGPIAEENQITICIEPLNSREDNLITSVARGAQFVDEIAHPNIQLLADLYHIETDNEPLENVAAASHRLRHVHVADAGRVAPGFAEEGEADFKDFFVALRRANYDASTHIARCSFEGKSQDIFAQAAPLIAFLKRRYQDATL